MTLNPPQQQKPPVQLTPEELRARLKRWHARLHNLADLQLPTDYPRPMPLKIIEAFHTLPLSESLSLALLQLSLALQVGEGKAQTHPSPFIILLAAFAVLLQRYTGDEEFAVGSSSDSGNPLVLKLSVNPENTFEDIVRMAHKMEQEAANDEVPFTSLIDALQPSSTEENRQPLFRIRFFNHTDAPSESALAPTSASTDLTIIISSHSSSSLRDALLPRLEVGVSYNQVLFSPARVEIMLEQLVRVVETVSKNTKLTVGDIPLVTRLCQEVIPNPTANLKWSEWRGAIHDIFEENARRHPDRICVVESRDEGRCTFTYAQINRATNMVAHHLLRNGIRREDVVMIYAYRGVDLVVAIMGVLRAGATFSVIDPAYPPSRQQIYLSVATPRGIIVLEKAGRLDEAVEGYIKDNLDIACRIPALRLEDNGTLCGGTSESSQDILDPIRELSAQGPGVVVGPDSIGTLSFTSGSTGIPKGVRGRHFSLTHYYPWMAQQFGLSSEDRFTMLSGIAHDPIQRDIFTPLFLGAQLWIPTGEDIGIPGRLAEWMATSGVTVTHLTPAMGQLLSSHAQTPIPTLHHAFFVGDILTKRDTHRLQKAATNAHIINMYGTTETQRSVSYYDIPPLSSHPAFLSSQKDVMPAGKGMCNVQLLVVNRKKRDIMCGVGEVGEIYVRAGGLAEGYLRLPEATAEKFLENWFPGQRSAEEAGVTGTKEPWREFWKGARDRLYRTGDLGRCVFFFFPLSLNLVECTGRADDQVKIRGFRVELGEIDTHLSQHPLVRENVTLVRRDKYEEQTLVSYFIPVSGADLDEFLSSTDDDNGEEGERGKGLRSSRKYKRLIRNIREYLKTKLPSYAVPSVFVPLKRMPLTPNGKIDKPALPFPDTMSALPVAPAMAAPKRSPTEQAIHDIWTRLLPNPPQPFIPLDENFFDLGGHSILATRLIFEVRKACFEGAPLSLVFREPTIQGMAREIDRLQSSDLNLAGDDNKSSAAPTPTRAEAGESAPNGRRSPTEEFNYAADLPQLFTSYLPAQYAPVAGEDLGKSKTYLLTGATGFLGAFILATLLRLDPSCRVICHVRSKSPEAAVSRIIQSAKAHLVWDDAYHSRIEAVCGDLASEKLGVSDADWQRLAQEVDAIVHNGALVHWVYPYSKLRPANVEGTAWALQLAGAHHTKSFTFVSSTSVLDTEHYVRLSDAVIEQGGRGVSEEDSLEGSREGLRSGYGQSKWVAEKLTLEARRRGLPAAIVRPGYVLGSTETGVSNTDDFIWRLVKGCVELGSVPQINNAVNMCPVDYVARCVAEVAKRAAGEFAAEGAVFHVTHPVPAFRFNDLFGCLPAYGYEVKQHEYITWRNALTEYTLQAQDNALFPLLHFVLDDLPTSTKSPELDDTNTQRLLQGAAVPRMTEELIGLYLAYLTRVGFMTMPNVKGARELPELKAVGQVLGRTGASH
ncbi:uncharacterized protein VTP21DRAFT_754 [Calcarisporiella thermophila]|uniref:uncharacterized protein n=1 Tax=Calcarisporiella thermophila TaxID=911321 RepID=UPI003742CD61